MDYRSQTLDELSRKRAVLTNRTALVGFDGFVDKIMTPVDKRTGQGSSFTPIPTIADFGKRICAAAGQSTNIEMYPRMEKLGGNGPIMANALLAGGMGVRYIGALGDQGIHPVLADFARRTEAVSLCQPSITHALEFTDGKIMLGDTSSLDHISYPRILQRMGEGAFLDALNRADLVAIVNWTMTPNLTAVLSSILDKALPNLGPKESGRCFFFDLADPEKRSTGDLLNVLRILRRFRSFGQATLGLNLKEALQVNRALGHPDPEGSPEALCLLASRLRQDLDLTCVVVHPTHGAACASRDESSWVDGPVCPSPLITTGAGDHFNAGFAIGQLIGLSYPACLTLAVAFSGYYVRTAQSPSLDACDQFIREWSA